MNIDDIFNKTERQKIWNEIVDKSKDSIDKMERAMDFGYAQGVVGMLSIIKKCDNMTGDEIYKAYIDKIKDSDIDKMVRRLMKYK